MLSFTGTGHLNPLILLSQHLKERGHKITFFEKPKIEDRVRQAGLDSIQSGWPSPPLREGRRCQNPGLRSRLSTLRFNLKRIAHDLEIYLEETPSALEASRGGCAPRQRDRADWPNCSADCCACPISSSPLQFLITSDGMIFLVLRVQVFRLRGFPLVERDFWKYLRVQHAWTDTPSAR